MTITPGAARKLSRFLREHDAPLELLMFLERRAPAKKLPGQSLAQKKKTKKERERAEMMVLRAVVMRRAGGICELCGYAFGSGPTSRPHLHHLAGGRGRRRQAQRESNVMAIHSGCHDAIHRRPSQFLTPVAEWAARHGYTVRL